MIKAIHYSGTSPYVLICTPPAKWAAFTHFFPKKFEEASASKAPSPEHVTGDWYIPVRNNKTLQSCQEKVFCQILSNHHNQISRIWPAFDNMQIATHVLQSSQKKKRQTQNNEMCKMSSTNHLYSTPIILSKSHKNPSKYVDTYSDDKLCIS